MAKATPTAIRTTRGDGTLHFRYPAPVSQQVCHWTLVLLWVLAPLTAIAALWL